MKSLAALALAILLCVPAMAQVAQPPRQSSAPSRSIEIELLELEQDVDRAILREALTLLGRQGMKPVPDHEAGKKQHAEEASALRDFIDKKKEAIIERAGELRKSRLGGTRSPAATSAAPAAVPAPVDRQTTIEKYENAQAEIQLLQAQVNLLQAALRDAVNALAKAELAAGDDESEKPKVAAVRKEYEKIKAKVVEYNKRLRLEQTLAEQSMQSMQMMGMGGSMGGGMR